jgi:hypothetical protein
LASAVGELSLVVAARRSRAREGAAAAPEATSCSVRACAFHRMIVVDLVDTKRRPLPIA